MGGGGNCWAWFGVYGALWDGELYEGAAGAPLVGGPLVGGAPYAGWALYFVSWPWAPVVPCALYGGAGVEPPGVYEVGGACP